MELVLANLAAKVRREQWDGRQWLVAPVRMLQEQVLAGSQGPLFYPQAEIARDPGSWNGVPIVLRHPVDNGLHVSARSPKILERQGLGYVFEANVGSGPLDAEAWLDEVRVKRLAPQVYASIQAGQAVSVSTGLFTSNEVAVAGSTHNGRAYSHIARYHRPDHLAVLEDEAGACSITDGCGLMVNADEPQKKAVAGYLQGLWRYLIVRGITAKPIESAEPPTDNADFLARARLQAALHASGGGSVEDVAEGHVVFERDGKRYRQAYTDGPEGATLDGEPVEVARIEGYHRKVAQKAETVANEEGEMSDEELRGTLAKVLKTTPETVDAIIAGSTPTVNAGVTTMPRQDDVTYLVTNCECWKGKEKVLANADAFTDEDVVKLRANAEKAAKDAQFVTNAMTMSKCPECGAMAMSGGECSKCGYKEGEKKKMATNVDTPQPLTARLTAEELQVWNHAVQITNDVKAQLVGRLTAQFHDQAARTQAVAVYNAMPLPQLQVLAAGLPQQQPADSPFAGVAAVPLYHGAAGAPATNAAKDDSDNVLPIVNYDFDQHASPALRRKQA